MVYAAIGGMQLKRWTGYFRIIWPTLRVLRAAKRTPGCLGADTFKAGDVYFAVSYWETRTHMQDFARTGLHGALMRLAIDEMALFHNHSVQCDGVPDRAAAAALWRSAMAARGGKGTVGSYSG